MRNLPVIIGIVAACAFADELPICEEFHGEEHIRCVSTDEGAVVISNFADAVQYEFYAADGRKGYIYLDGGVIANTARRHLKVASIPAENKDAYIREVFNAVMADIHWERD